MKTRTELKNYFSRGATPTEEQFGFLIDSSVNVTDDFSGTRELTKLVSGVGASNEDVIFEDLFEEGYGKILITSIIIHFYEMDGSYLEVPLKYVRVRLDTYDLTTVEIVEEDRYEQTIFASGAIPSFDSSDINIECEASPTGVTSYKTNVYIKYYRV